MKSIKQNVLLASTMMFTFVMILGSLSEPLASVFSSSTARVLLILFSIATIATSRLFPHDRIVSWALVLLLVITTLRTISDSIVFELPLWQKPAVLLPLLLTVILVCLAILMFESKQELPRLAVIAVASALLVILISRSAMSARETLQQGLRFGGETLNPIIISSFSLSLLIVSVSKLLSVRSPSGKWICSASIAVCLLGTILPSTRSQFILLLLSACIVGVSMVKYHSVRLKHVLSFAAFSIFLIFLGAQFLVSLGGNSLFSRFTSESATGGIQNRSYVIPRAFEAGLDNPVLGLSLGVREVNYLYPHNSVAQAFMAFGIVGGIFFTALLFAAVIRCVWILWSSPLTEAWPWLICLQWLLTSLSSYSMFFEPAMMASLVFALIQPLYQSSVGTNTSDLGAS